MQKETKGYGLSIIILENNKRFRMSGRYGQYLIIDFENNIVIVKLVKISKDELINYGNCLKLINENHDYTNFKNLFF